ncbi:hypothetical protein PISMIDRAFT_541655 [Pisolithus microcarpus 441]|uniref:Uncharacterized protein n=1 Tax=Pisolithus microcarpus 441 TaxID=765257 RepID=A0A0C9YA29_9AGAM|nr:hypothetical protein PISMIDRAFT_541655 [Pisolithus microcarpus 441]
MCRHLLSTQRIQKLSEVHAVIQPFCRCIWHLDCLARIISSIWIFSRSPPYSNGPCDMAHCQVLGKLCYSPAKFR